MNDGSFVLLFFLLLPKFSCEWKFLPGVVSCNAMLILECKEQSFPLFRKYIQKNKWTLFKPQFLHFYKLNFGNLPKNHGKHVII